MGWLFRNKANTPKTYAEIKQEIINIHRAVENAPVRYDVLQASLVGKFWVVACKVTPLTDDKAEAMRNDLTYEIDENGSYTFASIIETAWHEGGWGYKDLSETSGVYGDFTKVPVSLINKLSKIKPDTGEQYDPNKCAREWRESILASKKKPTIKDGMKIRLTEPALFSVGKKFSVYCSEFTATTYQRKNQNRRCYVAHDLGGQMVRLNADNIKQGWEHVA